MASKVEFIKETVKFYGVSITIVKETKSKTRSNPQRIRFWVKINDHYTCFFDTVEEAERFASGCYHGLSYAFDIARKNGSNFFEKCFAQSK